MAIKIVFPKDPEQMRSFITTCEILADSEADITGLGSVVDDGELRLQPEPGSLAYTASFDSVYQLSPSGKWTKVGG